MSGYSTPSGQAVRCCLPCSLIHSSGKPWLRTHGNFCKPTPLTSSNRPARCLLQQLHRLPPPLTRKLPAGACPSHHHGSRHLRGTRHMTMARALGICACVNSRSKHMFLQQHLQDHCCLWLNCKSTRISVWLLQYQAKPCTSYMISC